VQGYQGALAIAVNGRICGQAELPLMMMMISSVGASIGEDHGLAVSDRYKAPYPYSGTLHFVDIEVGNTSDAEVAARSRAEMARQ
jgi:arylsulfatase